MRGIRQTGYANTEQQDEIISTPTSQQNKVSAEALETVSGSITESTLLQAQSICKVKVQLKDVKDHVTAIALSDSSRVRGINFEDGLYHTHKGKSKVFVINTFTPTSLYRKRQSLDVFKSVKLLWKSIIIKFVMTISKHKFSQYKSPYKVRQI